MFTQTDHTFKWPLNIVNAFFCFRLFIFEKCTVLRSDFICKYFSVKNDYSSILRERERQRMFATDRGIEWERAVKIGAGMK